MRTKPELKCPHCGSISIGASVNATSYYTLCLDDKGRISQVWDSTEENSDFDWISCDSCYGEICYEDLLDQEIDIKEVKQ